MIDAIFIISKETGENWHTILLALKDRNLLTGKQCREIEDYFFDREAEMKGIR